MNHLKQKTGFFPRRNEALLTFLSAAFLLSGCGGGGGSDGSGTGASGSVSGSSPTTSTTSTPAPSTPAAASPTPSVTTASVVSKGPVTALSGITVNNVRYEDRTATVTINGRQRSIDDIRLGMMVEIEAERNSASSVSTAKAIKANSFVEGRIDAIDRSARTITVMGTVIKVPTATVFEGWTGLDDPLLKAGDFVEVHGLSGTEAAGAIATRIERKSAAGTGVENFSVSGEITQVNSVAKTFVLSGTTISYLTARIENVGAGLANGMVVRVEGSSAAPGFMTATEINGTNFATDDREGFSVEQEGIMSNYDSPSATFKVNGVRVNASNARMDGILANQVRVKVQGVLKSGVLVASKVERLDQGDGDSGKKGSR